MQMGRCCHCDPPTILPGKIYRFVYPSFPADYAAIATASWSIGTSGNTSQNFNCRYVTLTTPNRRATSATIITDPVRYSIYGPASDGGTFDYWYNYSTGSVLKKLQFGQGNGLSPITDGMIPAASHAEWVGGQLSLSSVPVPAVTNTTEPSLYNADGIPHTLSMYAFAHRVNGSIVGAVKTYPFTAADYICTIADGDSYEVDVWYKLAFTASLSLPATSGFVNRWMHTTRVSNGSRFLTIGTFPSYFLAFENANFSPAFNITSQTYEISISGQTGWTLLDGSNGPIAVQTYSGHWNGSVSDGSAEISRVNTLKPVEKIVLEWNKEIAHVTVHTPASFFASAGRYIYRSTTAASEYRTSTTSTDFGAINHTWYGIFNQSGTTVFEYVPWGAGVAVDGVYANAATTTKPPELPQTITFTRIPRPTTGSTTYDSGSGTFRVPDGKTILQIEGWGGGGGGGAGGAGGGSNGGSGGGGGGYFRKTIAVSPGDLIAYSVGSGGAGGIDGVTDVGSAGGNTTVSGGTYTANGGSGGDYGDNDPTVAASGGTASGGDTNTTGSASLAVTISDDGSAGGAGGGTDGGAGGAGGIQSGAEAQAGTGPGGGGGGGAKSARPGGAGANGRVKFSY